METKLSLVVPVRNESEYIGNMLASINEQSIKPDEIVFVISDDDSGSLEIINYWLRTVHGIYIHIWHRPPKGIAEARNWGSLHANGDIIVHTDADCILPPDYFYSVKTFFNHHRNVNCIYGKVYFTDNNFWSFAYEKLLYHGLTPAMMFIGIRPVVGSCMAMTKESLHKKQFNTSLKFGEDNDIARKLHGVYVPETKVFTSNRRVDTSFKTVYYIYMCFRYFFNVHAKEYKRD